MQTPHDSVYCRFLPVRSLREFPGGVRYPSQGSYLSGSAGSRCAYCSLLHPAAEDPGNCGEAERCAEESREQIAEQKNINDGAHKV